jgi:amino acid transporter
MQRKFLSITSLVLLQVVIVGNLQLLPANAVYGFSLPFLYLLGVIGFFLPCILMTAELATTRPQTGGAYIWCEQAFGQKAGFFTAGVLWIANVLWYPSFFSLIAINAAYLVAPALANNKTFIVSFALIAFWLITYLNCLGVKISSRISCLCAIIGIILPIICVILGGVDWWFTGHPLAISLKDTPLIPNFHHLSGLGYLIAVAISLAGIELTAVHAGNVIKPKQAYPISVFIAGIILIALLLSAELAIAIIVPANQLSVASGLLDALKLFCQQTHWQHLLWPILLLVFLGNVGSITAWMLGVTRGMLVACQRNHTAKILQKTNRRAAPIGILIFEAIIFTLASCVFLLFPSITDSFWLILDVSSQISLIYYVILFMATIRLRDLPPLAEGFIVPGGKILLWILMGLGIITATTAFLLGYIPPADLTGQQTLVFHSIMSVGLIIAILLPLLLLAFKEK